MNYGCDKCGGSAFEVQMRRIAVFAGPNNELQTSGIVPVSVCANPECGAFAVQSNLNVGERVPLSPTPVVLDPAKLAELRGKMQDMQKATDAEAPAAEAPAQEPKGKPPVN